MELSDAERGAVEQAADDDAASLIAALERRIVELESDLQAARAAIVELQQAAAERAITNLTPPAASDARVEPFTIYHHVDQELRNGAASLHAGAVWMPMLPNKVFRAERAGSWTDVSAENIQAEMNRIGIPVTYDGPILLDYEPWGPSREWNAEIGIPAMIRAVEAVRQRCPNAKIALHGIPATRTTVNARTTRPEADEWSDIWPHVDFIAPQIYTSSTEWPAFPLEKLMGMAMEVGRARNLPVLPVVRFRTTNEEWLATDLIIERLGQLRAAGADGIIVWDIRKSREDRPDAEIAARLRAVTAAMLQDN